MTSVSGSPQLLKGEKIGPDQLDPIWGEITFQYNVETLCPALQPQLTEGGVL